MARKYSLFILLFFAIVNLEKIYPITKSLEYYHEDTLLRGGRTHIPSKNKQDLDDDEDYDEPIIDSKK